MSDTLFTRKGNTAGFDVGGRAVTGWYGKDKLWHVAQIKEVTAEYLTNGTHRLFGSNIDASIYAAGLIDGERTAALKWWH